MIARNIYGIGRNFAEHAQELGNAISKEPVVFTKPMTSLIEMNKDGVVSLKLPTGQGRIDYEGEIVMQIGSGGSVTGFAPGIDVTARDLQTAAKKAGLPWTLAKGQKGFAPIGPMVKPPLGWEQNPERLGIRLSIAGQTRQDGHAGQMLFSIPTLVSYLTQHFALGEGDLVFTGTPPGVGPIEPGREIQVELRWDDQVLSTLKLIAS